MCGGYSTEIIWAKFAATPKQISVLASILLSSTIKTVGRLSSALSKQLSSSFFLVTELMLHVRDLICLPGGLTGPVTLVHLKLL